MRGRVQVQSGSARLAGQALHAGGLQLLASANLLKGGPQLS